MTRLTTARAAAHVITALWFIVTLGMPLVYAFIGKAEDGISLMHGFINGVFGMLMLYFLTGGNER